ncbi:MAG: SLC13 family permease [Lactococcus sp.]|uniref:SLC13 family permease n=1 Tax=Lactococcus sp. TaxID=44273 RepID=UPI0035AE1021
MEHTSSEAGFRKLLAKIWQFFYADKVFLISFFIALNAMVFGQAHFTTEFFDWKVIATVFGLMLVIGGFRESGLLRYIGETMVSKSKTTRQLVRFTTNLTFFLAVFFTNDLTILTMLPLYLYITKHVENRKSVYLGAAFIVPACHMGSTLLPFGNPHNLYVYNFFHLSSNNLEFFKGTVPMWILGLIVLNLACLLIDKDPIHVDTKPKNFNIVEVMVFVALMVLMATSVFTKVAIGGINFYWIATGITALIVFLYKRELFKTADYHLILTFMCFFIIVGNLVDIHQITTFVSNIGATPQGAFLGTVLISQVISNISSAVLMSPFTSHGMAVLLGADVGGVGMLTASMATLIAYKVIVVQAHGELAGFAKYFAYCMVGFLIVLTLLGLLVVSVI